MGELLREVQRELKLPTVLVTHDAAEATALADTVILCECGRVIRQSEPGTVLTGPNGRAAAHP
jgi:ABC-type sulfate/molybdate transport systems ATPase subunit